MVSASAVPLLLTITGFMPEGSDVQVAASQSLQLDPSAGKSHLTSVDIAAGYALHPMLKAQIELTAGVYQQRGGTFDFELRPGVQIAREDFPYYGRIFLAVGPLALGPLKAGVGASLGGQVDLDDGTSAFVDVGLMTRDGTVPGGEATLLWITEFRAGMRFGF